MVLKTRLPLLAALAIAALLAFGAAACGDDDKDGDATPTTAAQPTAPQNVETPGASATPAASDIGEDHPAAVAARQVLIDTVGIAPEDIVFISGTAMTFSNSCLDVSLLTATPEVCAQVITPGYEMVFQTGTTFYILRSDESGDNVRLADVDVGGADQIDVP